MCELRTYTNRTIDEKEEVIQVELEDTDNDDGNNSWLKLRMRKHSIEQ